MIKSLDSLTYCEASDSQFLEISFPVPHNKSPLLLNIHRVCAKTFHYMEAESAADQYNCGKNVLKYWQYNIDNIDNIRPVQ